MWAECDLRGKRAAAQTVIRKEKSDLGCFCLVRELNLTLLQSYLEIAFDKLCCFDSRLHVETDIHLDPSFMVSELDDGHLRGGGGVNTGAHGLNVYVCLSLEGMHVLLRLTVALSRTLMGCGPATLRLCRACSSSWSGGWSHFPNTTKSMSLWQNITLRKSLFCLPQYCLNHSIFNSLYTTPGLNGNTIHPDN